MTRLGLAFLLCIVLLLSVVHTLPNQFNSDEYDFAEMPTQDPMNDPDDQAEAVIRSCLSEEEQAASPIFVDPSRIRIDDGRIIFGKNFTLWADIDIDSERLPVIDRKDLHLSFDAGRIGRMAGVNFEGDICDAMNTFYSSHSCPLPGGTYPDFILGRHYVPRIPGGGLIRRVDLKVKILKMVDGENTSDSQLLACFTATIPVRSSEVDEE